MCGAASFRQRICSRVPTLSWRAPIRQRFAMGFAGFCALVTLAGCADDAGFVERDPLRDTRGEPHPLLLWNQSQYSLYQLSFLPPDLEDPTLSVEELARDERVMLEDFRSGSAISFVRDKVQGGAQITIETQAPVYIDAEGYTLLIFDDAFRLLEPAHPQNPQREPNAP